MESPKTKIRWTLWMEVNKVWLRTDKVWVSGFGKDAVFKDKSIGHYVNFKHSSESIFFGVEKPELSPGDKVRVTFEKET